MKALRAAGMAVRSTAIVGQGFPDLAVGWRGRNFFLELKDGDAIPSKKRMTSQELEFHTTWPGQVRIVESPEEAVKAVTEEAKRMGVL